jgi:hypothetical protein
MKPIFQLNHRYHLIRPAARTSDVSRKTDCNHRTAALDDFDDGCAGAGKPPFYAIGQDYFVREANHHFATEAVVFFLLATTTVLPLMNAASAVVGLLHSSEGLL